MGLRSGAGNARWCGCRSDGAPTCFRREEGGICKVGKVRVVSLKIFPSCFYGGGKERQGKANLVKFHRKRGWKEKRGKANPSENFEKFG